MTTQAFHTPVMVEEVLNLLKIKPNGFYVDGTVGDGGHAEAILERSSPAGQVLGFDRDPEAVRIAGERLRRFKGRIKILHLSFDLMRKGLSEEYPFPKKVDGILLDLGTSSRQLTSVERGFSFSSGRSLDMRMDPTKGENASDLVNRMTKKELVDILKNYGEEKRWAGRISDRIIQQREIKRITTAKHLAQVVRDAIPTKYHSRQIHPATKVFQALRIAVNDELKRLERVLPDALGVLNAGGRLAVISFHSLEDRIAKRFFLEKEKGCVCPPKFPKCVCGEKPILKRIIKKPIIPQKEEIEKNPRSRSAKLRVVEKLT